MSLSSDKGRKLETDIAKLIRRKGLGSAHRNPGSGNKWYRRYDLYTELPFHVEAKSQEKVQIHAWYQQAKDAASTNETPVVAFRTENHPEILATLKMSDLLDFMAEIGQMRAELDSLRTPIPPTALEKSKQMKVEYGQPTCQYGHLVDDRGYCLHIGCPYSSGYRKPKVKKK